MDLIERFFPYQLPRQYLYITDHKIRILIPQRENNQATFTAIFPNPDPLSILPPELLVQLQHILQSAPTGIILNPFYFIYNIFEFDRLPLNPKIRREMINWKLQKVFPENFEKYIHIYYSLKKGSIFSILVNKNVVDQLETSFKQLKIPLTYLGNSTLEIINYHLAKKTMADFFIEYDDFSVMMIFYFQNRLIYQRKSKIQSQNDIIPEIEKTLIFVSDQFGWKPKSFFLFSPGQSFPLEILSQEIKMMNIEEITGNYKYSIFLPGVK